MPNIYVYNDRSNAMEYYALEEYSTMPYVIGRTMTVREFRGSSRANTLWTDRRAMVAWNQFRSIWGQPISIFFAFKRIWEGGHSAFSQHYAGVAFDVGQNLSAEGRSRMRQAAVNSGVWSYVEPAVLTPRWVHFDERTGIPACAAGGYPGVMLGSVGVYVLIAQDALNALGFVGSGLDGYFGYGTRGAVIRFQQAQGLAANGIVDCATWRSLTTQAVGIGRTPTVVNA